jgi:hypothetical protein
MKVLSLNIDDAIFEETELVISELKLGRNKYINDALHLYNSFNKRQVLKNKLAIESGLAAKSSSEVLAEFEEFVDEI